MLTAAFSAVLLAATAAIGCVEIPEPAPQYAFNPTLDMQTPELPTGCEATAISTLLRINGVEVTKTEVADAMPKGIDWVNNFWGDPYSSTGWACMAPCGAATANLFLDEKNAVVLKGEAFADLPLPCAVWVSIDLAEPVPSGYEREGYRLFQNTHCMVLMDVGEDTVHVIDPLAGEMEYERTTFERIYEILGMQAVYIS